MRLLCVCVGVNVHKKPPMYGKNSSLLKKHVKFSACEKTKVCCTEVYVANKDNGKNGCNIIVTDTLRPGNNC